MEHKYQDIVQVGDKVKYKTGAEYYIVKMIHYDGYHCDVIRDNKYANEYHKIPIKRLEVVEKNVKLLSHKDIEDNTLNKPYRDKTNPHNEVSMKYPTKKKAPKTKKIVDYLVTEYSPLNSIHDKATENDNVHSRKVVTGEKELSEYILELDSIPINNQIEVRVLGRVVKTDIKKEVIIK